MNTPDKNGSQGPLKFLIFSASLRSGSLNTRLARLAAKVIEQHGNVVDFGDMNEFDCPAYNTDVEKKEGLCTGAMKLYERIRANDAMIIACPEYNASLPGHLKNAIDWVSRYRPQPFNELHSLLLSASPSMVGGNRGLWSLRIPLEHLGSRVFPDMFSLAMAHQAFNDDGTLKDPILATRFNDNIQAFSNLVEAAKHYPCIKKAWVEFLGEKPDPVTERVE